MLKFGLPHEEIDGDEEYKKQTRLLFKIWDDVEKVWKGLPQNNPEVYTWDSKFFDEKDSVGNTCLIKILGKKDKYRFVRGGYITEFNLDEPVLKFYSFLDNNTVPQPVIVTKNFIYDPEENKKIRRNKLPRDFDFRNEYPELKYNHGKYESFEYKTTKIRNWKIIQS